MAEWISEVMSSKQTRTIPIYTGRTQERRHLVFYGSVTAAVHVLHGVWLAVLNIA
jgi:hypothetical protein